MNTTEMRELNVAELDRVSGAQVKGWHECVIGTKHGGGPGLWPDTYPCSNGQMADLAQLVLQTAAQGRVILGGAA